MTVTEHIDETFQHFFDSGALPADTEAQQRPAILQLLFIQQADRQMHAPLTLDQDVPDNASCLIAQAAPVLMVPDVVNSELCQQLIAHWRQDRKHGATGYNQHGPGVRHADRELSGHQEQALANPELNSDLNRCLVQSLVPAVARCFHYHADRFEGFRVVACQGHDVAHGREQRDNCSADNRHRRFAMCINLNDDFQGGELVFPEFGPHRYRPPAGGAIVYSCSLSQRMMPVTVGCRFTALTFFWSGALR